MKLSKHIELFINLIFYNKFYRKTKRLLNSKHFCTKEEIERYQFKELKKIIEYAYNNVPYYNELFRNIGFHPDKFITIEDIKKIPYLTKNIIRGNKDKLVSVIFPKKYLKYAKTGGTTGLPMEFVLDKRSSSLIEMAYLENMWKRVNYKRFDRCVILREDKVENIIEGKKYWKMNYTTNWLTMSAFHLNADTFSIFHKKILSFKPRFIIAFPSNAYLLAKFIKETNAQNIPSLKAVLCSSENMYEWQRKFMEKIFKVRIFSHYGHSEKCIIASECANSTFYEFYPQYGFVELINENNNWCTKEDERGEIVATGFNNYASPLIRYKTNDIGIYTTKHCSDNHNWITIKKIEGRIQSFLVDKDNIPKTSIHLDRPFWNIHDKIYSYQYIQDTPGKVLLNIHANKNLSPNQIEYIKKVFFETYLKFEIEVKQVDFIPKTKSGKFVYLVQNIKNVL